jgi:hypothetical protein
MDVGEPHRYNGNGPLICTSPPTSNNKNKLRMPGTADQQGSRPASYSPVGKRRQTQPKTPMSSNSTVSSHQSTFSSTSRLYRAPQPALRIYQHIAPSSSKNPKVVNGVEMVMHDAGCSTRRRRKDSVNSSIASIGRSERSKKDKMKSRKKIWMGTLLNGGVLIVHFQLIASMDRMVKLVRKAVTQTSLLECIAVKIIL